MIKVLVIDDNDALRKLVAKMLTSNGFEVITAANGKQGVDLYREQSPDLVITDVIMADMDGVEVIAALRKIAPEAKIIVMSGGGQAGSGEDYLRSIDLILNTPYNLAKPFAMDDLLKMVNKTLEGQL